MERFTAREMEMQRRVNARAVAPILAQAVLALPPHRLKAFITGAVPTFCTRAEADSIFAAVPELRGA